MNTSGEFLKDEFNKRKAKNPNFSLRSFARWLEISPAQISQMMSGKRPLTLKALEKINKKLDLSPLEKQVLVDTVVKSNSYNEETENQMAFRSLSEDQFKVISDWYHVGILGLTRLPEAKPDPRWIARKLSISTEEANQALQRLVRLNMLSLSPRFKQIGDPLKVISNIPSAAIRRYHKQNLQLASEKIEMIENSKRDFQSLSIPINSKDLPKLKEHIDRFLNQVQKFSDKSKPDQIYNLNLQLFPITPIGELP
ncbi:MAG: TIGR02147 family protein [Bdellovibrionaceae bacterium]|nr:TIGR02147 family protein [Pseudobdellovibrionaceae bacterium]